MTAPACPLCGRDLVPSKRLTGYWECPDGTCSGLLREADGLPAWDEVLGSSIPDLMQASATSKKGGSSGGSRGRQKPRKVTAYRRERRYLDQAPAGGRDREPVPVQRHRHLAGAGLGALGSVAPGHHPGHPVGRDGGALVHRLRPARLARRGVHRRMPAES
jgi:hypothetical protein